MAIAPSLPALRRSFYGGNLDSAERAFLEGAYAAGTTAAILLPSLPNLASAAALTLPANAATINVTGTTGITSIVATRAGDKRTLLFAGILTVTDGSNLKLNGNLTTGANTTLSLLCDGTNWIETSRSVNG